MTALAPPGGIPAVCQRVAASGWFQSLTSTAIIANAVILGLLTYPSNEARFGGLLEALDTVLIGFFILELGVRIAAHGRNPLRFFRDGWNIFDFIVVTAAFVPGVRENVTLLRLARLARVLRLVRIFPTLRIIIVAVGRSLPGALGLFAVAAVVLYLYGMVGWLMFGERYPEQFGTIGEAALTLFLLLTLEGLGDLLHEGLAVSPWSLAYYVSFVLFGAFVLVNILIGVVLNSMEEARRIEAEEDKQAMPADPVVDRLDALHATIATIASARVPDYPRHCPEPCCVASRASTPRRTEHHDVQHHTGIDQSVR